MHHPINPVRRSVVAFIRTPPSLRPGPNEPGIQEKDLLEPSAEPSNNPGASQINTLMKRQSNPSLIRRHNIIRHEIGFTKARVAGADQQLAASSRNRLDQRETEVINRSVQTKNRSISGAVSKAVAIPITRRSAPILDAMKK